MAYNEEAAKIGILTPQEKLKVLSNYSDAVEVDPNIPANRYFRSGVEMVRMAEVYAEEGGYENAYVLYMKYMTLFLEKIRKHPQYASVPSNIKSVNQAKLRQILPVAEKLKAVLIEQYTREYNLFTADLKRQKEKEARDAREALRDAGSQSPDVHPTLSFGNTPTPCDWAGSHIVSPHTDINKVIFPDLKDLTDEKSRETLPVLPTTHAAHIPSFDRAKKPSFYSESTSSMLRTVVVPSEIMNKFLMLARKNTMSNVETCGLLAGELARNQLAITTLIIPKQVGTPDSCAMLNEEELFAYQDELNLITIGWIHTHPTQTAFLSSVDLHTHCPYQILLPEAIAVVCAPKYNETGFFTLTGEYGIGIVSKCQDKGFHPHVTDPPLFINAEHIKLDDTIPLTVKDFRD